MNAAHLTLRFGPTRLRADVYWAGTSAPSVSLVLADELAPHDPLVRDCLVVALPGHHPRAEQLGTLGWLAEHATELGAASDRLLVAGGARAAHLAIAVRDQEWPVLHRQLLVHPRFSRGCPMPSLLSGVAPATVVHGQDGRDHGRRYAARLREDGVEVEEIGR